MKGDIRTIEMVPRSIQMRWVQGALGAEEPEGMEGDEWVEKQDASMDTPIWPTSCPLRLTD